MNKFKYLIIGLFIIISFSGCKKDIDWNALGLNTSPLSGNGVLPNEQNEAYFISYKADGVVVTPKEISAVRIMNTIPRSLTISATMSNGTSPKFKFYSEESSIGFVSGLNTGNSIITYPSSYVEYSDSSNKLFSTITDSEGVHVFFSDISYTNGGIIKGTFSGQVKDTNGSTIQITEGKMSLKFIN